MSFLTVQGIEKSFGTTRVLRDVDLTVERGELLALLGPSGSGKSTLLRIISGFERQEKGTLLLEGKSFDDLDPQRRGFGMVFQSYALFPHLTVADNVAFGLADLEPAVRRQRVDEMLQLVQMEELAERGIDQISGGQQQRVALARALAPRPKLLLLDEPLSNLDPSLRDRTRRQLRSILRQVGITAVLVTHEQEEAFELGDRVAVLDCGRIEQVGSPEQLYRDPSTAFVAGFIGRANTFPAQRVSAASNEVQLAGWSGGLSISTQAYIGGPATEKSALLVWARPEHLAVQERSAEAYNAGSEAAESSDLPACYGRVRGGRLLGPYCLVQVELDAPAEGTAEVASRELLAVGTEVEIHIAEPEAVRMLVD